MNDIPRWISKQPAQRLRLRFDPGQTRSVWMHFIVISRRIAYHRAYYVVFLSVYLLKKKDELSLLYKKKNVV